jgi:transposase
MSVMVKLLSSTARDWREGRRLRAWELKQAGWKQRDIARALGVTEGAVSQWCTRAEEEGVEGLYRRPAPGAKPRLSEEEKARLLELLARGAEAFGFRGSIWTLERVAEVIRREFGVSYHPSHIGRILRACGWSRQKPIRRATQRDEAAIRRWVEERWPEIEKGA